MHHCLSVVLSARGTEGQQTNKMDKRVCSFKEICSVGTGATVDEKTYLGGKAEKFSG